MNRWLIRLLTLTLVPVLVVTTSVEADAGTKAGPVAKATIGGLTVRNTSGWVCDLSAYFLSVGDSMLEAVAVVKGKAWCDTGTITDDTYVGGIRLNGSACIYQADLPNWNIDETDQQEFEWLAPKLSGADMCGGIVEVCLEVGQTGEWFQDGADWDWYCEQIDLGSPLDPTGVVEDPDEHCPHGRPANGIFSLSSPYIVITSQGTNQKTEVMRQDITFRLRNPLPPDDGARSDWWAYVIYSGGAMTTHTGVQGDVSVSSQNIPTARVVYSPFLSGPSIEHKMTVTVSGSMTTTFSTGATSGSLDITRTPKGGGWALTRPTLPQLTASTGVVAPSTPGEYGGKAVGWTDPAACVWYRGVKAVNADNIDFDEPWNGLPEPVPGEPLPEDPDDGGEEPVLEPPTDYNPDETDPPPGESEETACGDFTLWDPTSWAGAGICVLVEALLRLIDLMGAILDAIVGLAEAIVQGIIDALTAVIEAIIDALEALFVPDADLLQGHIDGLQGAFEGSPAGQWTDSLGTGFGGSPGGGCGGPSFGPFEIAGADVPQLSPFSSCGDAASAASITRTVLTLAVSLSGGFLILRMILTSLGIRTAAPSIGGGRDS